LSAVYVVVLITFWWPEC